MNGNEYSALLKSKIEEILKNNPNIKKIQTSREIGFETDNLICTRAHLRCDNDKETIPTIDLDLTMINNKPMIHYKSQNEKIDFYLDPNQTNRDILFLDENFNQICKTNLEFIDNFIMNNSRFNKLKWILNDEEIEIDE